MLCKECNKPLIAVEVSRNLNGHEFPLEMSTLVGYVSPPNHNHDDNCRSRVYRCEDGHSTALSRINRCTNPNCDWTGKISCWCHEDPKIKEWPLVSQNIVVYQLGRGWIK